MSKRLMSDLVKARESVKKKYKTLKADIAESQIRLSEQFKPLSQPLKDLISTIKTETSINDEPYYKNEDEEGEDEYVDEPWATPTKDYYEIDPRKSKSLSHLDIPPFNVSKREFDEFSEKLDVAPSTKPFYETLQIPSTSEMKALEETPIAVTTAHPTQIDYEPRDSVESISPQIDLSQYTGRALIYLRGLVTDVKNRFDHTTGVRIDSETPYLGNKQLYFDNNDIIIIDEGRNITYKGTIGLYKLLFKKEIKRDEYDAHDEIQYADLLKRSSVVKRNFDPNEKAMGHKGLKYQLIKKLLKPTPQRSGKGLLTVNSKRVEFIPWKDPNTLVNRLRLLLASQMAGHTGHRNEIVSIIDALTSAKIIRKTSQSSVIA